jgi:uncharacterized protein
MSDEQTPQFNELPEHSVEFVGIARPIAPETEPALPTEPPRPRVWTVFAVYVSGVVLGVIVSIVYLLAVLSGVSATAWLDELAERPNAFLGLLALTLCAALFVTMCAAFLSPARWICRLRLTAPSMSIPQIATSAIGATALGMMFTMAYALELVPRSSTLEQLAGVVGSLFGTSFMLGILVIGILPGIAEELLFRGYIQTRLSQRWGVRVSILLTALMFGAYHMDFSQGILAVGMGIYLGLVTERANSVIPAMVAHAANNTIGIVVSVSFPETESRALLWVLMLAGAVVLVVCLVHLRRSSPDTLADAAGD